MIERTAKASWRGAGEDAVGRLSSASGVLEDTPFSFHTRFVDRDPRESTSPEELLGAAHAACYAMSLGMALEAAETPPTSIDVDAVAAEGLGYERLDQLLFEHLTGVRG